MLHRFFFNAANCSSCYFWKANQIPINKKYFNIIGRNLHVPKWEKLLLERPKEFDLNENEIEEQFVKGSGKGGQKINKVRNCVNLKHVPSGTVIQCQKTRSLEDNRRIARKLLKSKLDNLLHGAFSKQSQKIKKIQKKKKKKMQRAAKKAQILKQKEGDKEDDFDIDESDFDEVWDDDKLEDEYWDDDDDDDDEVDEDKKTTKK